MKQRRTGVKIVRLLATVLAIAATLEVGGALAQQTTRPDTIRIDTLSRPDIERTINLCWDILKKYPDSEFAPTLMFQLMQLYMRSAELELDLAMSRYEEALKDFESGKTTVEPPLPRIDLSKAIDVGLTLLKTYPNVRFKAKVLYSLALCYDKQEMGEEYIATLERLIAECPDDPLVPETHFRIGEYYFDRRQYEKSVAAYSKLLDYWESPYFDMALYKLAWSYFNLGDYPNAISSFVYLIDDLDTVERSNPELMGRSKIDLRREAMQYIAVSFSEYGGPEKAREFFTDLGMRPWVGEVFLRLGKVYFARTEYGLAAKSYRMFSALFPEDPRAIDAAREVIRCQEAAGDVVNADRARADLLASFSPSTEWYRSLKQEAKEHADSVLVQTYLALGNNLTVAARDTKDGELYQRAVRVYKEFLAYYPDKPESDRVRFLLGEVFFESGQYRQAAEAYKECFVLAADSQYTEKAGWNRIFCWDKLAQKAPEFDSTQVELFDFLGDSVVALTVPNSETGELLLACVDFVKAFPHSPKWSTVMLKLSSTLFALERYEFAEKACEQLLDKEPPKEVKAKTLALMGQCRYRVGDFESAEHWYEQLTAVFPDSQQLQDTAARMRASARYKRAVELKQTGDAEASARLFAAAAEISPDEQLAAVSLFEAGAQYEKAGKTEEAIRQYDRLCSRFPNSKFADESLYRASLLREGLGEWAEAARGYRRLAELYPDSRFARHAFFLAGTCLENDSSFAEAARVYREYVQRFGAKDPDEYLDAMVRLAEIYRRNGDVGAAERQLQEALSAYNRFRLDLVQVDDYLAAKARFLLGEIAFAEYKAIQLTPPLKSSLKRKRDKFREVLKAYTEAAKFKVAEWTCAATHRIGEAFEEFARALWESPIPEDLTLEQKELYITKLAEQVKPFKEKAYQAYRRNVKLAEQTGLLNDWITKSRERAEELAIELNLPASPEPVPADSTLAERKQELTKQPGAEPR